MSLAEAETFRPKWSEMIHDEWVNNLLRQREDLNEKDLRRTRNLMNENALDSVVEDFEHLIPSLELPDEDDRHVLAVAIESKADCIVTFNLRDFPEEYLATWSLFPVHPDRFVLDLLRLDSASVLEAFETQRARLNSPPQSIYELASTLKQAGLKKSMARIEDLLS